MQSVETAGRQMLENVEAWMRAYGAPSIWIWGEEPDRVWFKSGEDWPVWVARMAQDGRLVPGNYRNHGETAIVGWREAVGRYGAQLVEHEDGLWEIDFDYWNPWDVVGVVGHLGEVVGNKLRKRKTDPWKVAKGLRKRGIEVQVYDAV